MNTDTRAMDIVQEEVLLQILEPGELLHLSSHNASIMKILRRKLNSPL